MYAVSSKVLAKCKKKKSKYSKWNFSRKLDLINLTQLCVELFFNRCVENTHSLNFTISEKAVCCETRTVAEFCYNEIREVTLLFFYSHTRKKINKCSKWTRHQGTNESGSVL